MSRTLRFAVPALALALLVLAGCGRRTDPPPASAAEGEEHAHKPAQHGGIIKSLGADSYHAEGVYEKGGIFRLYVLGRDETRVQEIEAVPLPAHVKAEGDTEAESLVLRPDPQPDDRKGMTSQFVAHLPRDLVGKRLVVTVRVRIGQERFRVPFESVPDGDDHGMPAGVSAAEE